MNGVWVMMWVEVEVGGREKKGKGRAAGQVLADGRRVAQGWTWKVEVWVRGPRSRVSQDTHLDSAVNMTMHDTDEWDEAIYI